MEKENTKTSNSISFLIIICLVATGIYYGLGYLSSRDKNIIKQGMREVLFGLYSVEKPTNLKPLETLRKEASKGDATAQTALAISYFAGWYGEEDRNEAVKWLRKAAVQNNEMAQYFLALCYFTGTGVEENESEAIEWLRLSAEHEDSDTRVSSYYMGYFYEKGYYIEKDKEKARKWYLKAAKQGDKNAEEALSRLD